MYGKLTYLDFRVAVCEGTLRHVFLPVTAFGKQAEFMQAHAAPGQAVVLEAHLADVILDRFDSISLVADRIVLSGDSGEHWMSP